MNDARKNTLWVWVAIVVLGALHQDFWWWDDRTLVRGFMPIGLFYHALFSLAAAGTWAVVVRFAWPGHLEEWADEFENAPAEGDQQ